MMWFLLVRNILRSLLVFRALSTDLLDFSLEFFGYSKYSMQVSLGKKAPWCLKEHNERVKPTPSVDTEILQAIWPFVFTSAPSIYLWWAFLEERSCLEVCVGLFFGLWFVAFFTYTSLFSFWCFPLIHSPIPNPFCC